MPKIPCRVESGPEGGRRGSRHVAGGGWGLFPAEKSPLPRPPSLTQKPLIGRTGLWGESREKTDRMTRQAEMEKMWPSLPPFCQRHARHHGSSLLPTACPSGIRFSHSFRSAPAALSPPAGHEAPFAFRLSSPVIEGAAWATYAEGVVPPLLRRAPHCTGDQRGARGGRGPGAAQAIQPGCRAMAVIRRLFHRAQADLFPASVPPQKTPKGPVSRGRPAPSQKRAQHGQPMRPSAAGGTRAKRRRTTGPRRRTWAWRTGCCPHGPGCRHGRAAGCWNPSHAPRA